MKRFWDAVAVARDGEDHRILLDGKPIHLPGGGVLLVGPRPSPRNGVWRVARRAAR
jgi:hypothetical protein